MNFTSAEKSLAFKLFNPDTSGRYYLGIEDFVQKMAQLFLLFVFCFISYQSKSFGYLADYSQVEVTSISYKNKIFGGWAEVKTGSSSPGRCVFGFYDQKIKTFASTLVYQSDDMQVATNPTIVATSDGSLHVVCLAAALNVKDPSQPYKRGVLVYARSTDQGISWSQFSEIVEVANGIADKPWIAADEMGGLAITYAEIWLDSSDLVLHSKTKIIASADAGLTWTKPIVVQEPPSQSLPNYDGFQGQWIDRVGNAWQLSLAQYGKGSIYFCSSPDLKTLCANPILVGKHFLEGAPITQIFHGNRSSDLGIIWYAGHSFGDIKYVISRDGGQTWGSPVSVINKGSLAHAQFMNDQIVVLSTDKTDNGLITRLRKYADNGALIEATDLTTVENVPQGSYIGAYQNFIVLDMKTIVASIVSYFPDQSLKIFEFQP